MKENEKNDKYGKIYFARKRSKRDISCAVENFRRQKLQVRECSIEHSEEILEKVKDAVKDQEIFHALLKSAKVKSYVEGRLTLMFLSELRGKHFEKMYKQKFEDTASKLFGKEIKVELEGAK